ncbi:cupin domain-containing protein [Streptacidiphilus sp. N1-12]|uniref:Cupin domain-containing protein n=2 Tax=Streptacidiphilus alkalitolerans TaxID=3342712 RepID=A0ABV6V7T3_9ACTN
MPYVRGHQAVVHEIHGVRFTAHANSGTGSRQIAAWQGEVPAGTVGVPHTVSHEEVIHVLSGALRFTIDGESADLGAGDTVIVPAGSLFGLDNLGTDTATTWVTTSVGLTATLPDGSTLTPPWAN